MSASPTPPNDGPNHLTNDSVTEGHGVLSGNGANQDRAGAAAILLMASVVFSAHLYRVFAVPTGTWREEEFFILYALVPAYAPENPISLFTHMLIHADWVHLGLNLLFFFLFGMVVARRIDSGFAAAVKVTGLTLVSGLGGGALVFAIDPSADNAVIGFSGAVCGVAAAFMLSQRSDWRDAVRDRRVLQSAAWFIGLNVFVAAGVSSVTAFKIAWEAHLGGFLAGAVCWIVLARRGPRSSDGAIL